MVGIGFFAPFPLALMVPFMAGQSLAMGEAFGKGFQYGKRKISSMSNEEFNALDFKGLSESIATDYKVMIPSITKSIEASDELQRAVFAALGDVIKDIPKTILDFFADIGGSSTSNTTTSTSASQLGTITEVRSGGREVTINEQGIIDAQKIIDQAILDAKALLSPFGGSTIKNITDAADREKLRLEELRIRQSFFNKPQPVTPRLITTPTGRKAGQSQILERNRLQKAISDAWNEYTADFRLRGRTGGIKIAQASLNKYNVLKAQLIALLKRYIF